jgi:hypothetical protein
MHRLVGQIYVHTLFLVIPNIHATYGAACAGLPDGLF